MSRVHPTDDLLFDYASGALGDGMSLLVASHLTYCPDCRMSAEADEAIGGALLADETSELSGPDLAAVLARIDAEQASSSEEITDDDNSPLPRPLREAVGVNFSDIRWRPRLPGLAEHVITEGVDDHGRPIKVSLLKARPGARIPEHTHRGDEATLVLTGAMEDGGVVYRKGDVALSDDHHDHQPRILDEGVCICLIVLNGGLRFTGTFGRALNLFT